MKIYEFKSFREYDFKPCRVNVNKEIVNKYVLNEFEKEPKFVEGILYISNGLNLKALNVNGNIIYNKNVIISNLEKYNLDYEIIHEDELEHFEDFKKDIETKLDKNILELRKLKEIDLLRKPGNPEVVECMLYTKNKGMEVLDCELIMPTQREGVYAGRLLNSSRYDKEFKKDNNVALKYLFQDEEPYLIIAGNVTFYED